jgi:hypothetical protein
MRTIKNVARVGLMVCGMAGLTFAEEAKSAAKADAGGYDIFILMGQSNADGRGGAKDLAPELAAPSKDHIIFYHNSNATTTEWEALAPGYSTGKSKTTVPKGGFGVEVSFGPALATAVPGAKVAIIKSAYGGTSLSFHWKPGTDANGLKAKGWQQGPGPCYRTALNAINMAVAKLPPGEHRLRGMLWHQGESDAGDRSYDKNLGNLITRLREDLKAPDLPFVLGGLRPGIGGKWNGIAANVTNLVKNAAFASAEGLEGDSLHFNSAALVTFGQRYAEVMAPMLKTTKPTMVKGGDKNYTLRDPVLVEQAAAAWGANAKEAKPAGK